MKRREPKHASLFQVFSRWTKTNTAARLGYALVVVAIDSFLFVLYRSAIPPRFGPTSTGDITIVSVVGGNGPTRGGASGWFSVLVRLPAGEEVHVTLREPLATGSTFGRSTGPS